MTRRRSLNKVKKGQTPNSSKKKRQSVINKSGEVSKKSANNMSQNGSPSPIIRKRKKPISESSSPSKKKKFKPNKSVLKSQKKNKKRKNTTLVPETFACSTPFRTMIGETPAEFEQATPIHTDTLPLHQYSNIVSAENFDTQVTNDGPASNTRSLRNKRKQKNPIKWRDTPHNSLIIEEPLQIIDVDSETDTTDNGIKTLKQVEDNFEFTLTQIIATKNDEVPKEIPTISQHTENNNELQKTDPSVMLIKDPTIVIEIDEGNTKDGSKTLEEEKQIKQMKPTDSAIISGENEVEGGLISTTDELKVINVDDDSIQFIEDTETVPIVQPKDFSDVIILDDDTINEPVKPPEKIIILDEIGPARGTTKSSFGALRICLDRVPFIDCEKGPKKRPSKRKRKNNFNVASGLTKSPADILKRQLGINLNYASPSSNPINESRAKLSRWIKQNNKKAKLSPPKTNHSKPVDTANICSNRVPYIDCDAPRKTKPFKPQQKIDLNFTSTRPSNDPPSELVTNLINLNHECLQRSMNECLQRVSKKSPSKEKRNKSKEKSNKVGSNVYNPTSTAKTGLRLIVIDGSNVAMGHSNNGKFSCEGLKICIDYFLKRGHEVKAFVPQYRRSRFETTNPELLELLAKQGNVIFTPSRRVKGRRIVPYDDRYIVQCAAEHDGIIVSNDNYRDLHAENPNWRETIDKRLLMWTWCGDMIMFPMDPCGRYGPTLERFLRF